ncbi:MAG TPA: LacI family DNA-binding transcriptional regulator [Mobilitalea sp.]|nr:LacI family DNA-binding transcriptional regulator [Mobilitalea sp.]
MSITAKELAKMLEISEAAVSMALNNKSGVSTATRQKVIETAKKHGYDFTRIEEVIETKTEKGNLSFIIYKKHGAVVTDSPFFNQLTEGIEQSCRKARYHLHINYLYGDEDMTQQLGGLSFYDGIILLATEMKNEDFLPFANLKTPIVVLDTYFQNLNYDCVLINNFQGAYQAANYIIRKTKAQPGYLHSSYPIGNFDERADGFYKAIRENGMSNSKSQVLSLTPSMDGAYKDMLDLLEHGEEPVRCYFADNDLIAAGAMKALKEKGYRIPEDVSMIGFDNMPFCTYIEPTLTTVHVPKQYMGEMAVQRLVHIIDSKDHFPIKIEVTTTIVKRKSV